jgi:hypothetical protein
MSTSILVTMIAGSVGPYRITKRTAVLGEGLSGHGTPEPTHLSVEPGHLTVLPANSAWALKGATGAQRYTERRELDRLVAVQPGLGREEASAGAMIAIRKTDAWWALAVDERRAIFEARSRHIEDSMRFLPAIARRLYHSRELGESFDFLTWFEFAPVHAALFDELLAQLRRSEEWRYVDRELELRLARG